MEAGGVAGAAAALRGRLGLSEPPDDLTARLQAWWLESGVRAGRDRLPWRSAATSPWGVLVSETMLAQTQVPRVAERYPAFMARYPTPAALAGDSLGEVLRLWQGLGYPRRAANLWQCARRLVSEHGGEVPADLEALSALPGVGRYTARALLAFAFHEPVMPVDTNIGRVLARLHGRRLSEREVQATGDSWAAEGRPRDAALALMDLGATRCRPEPRCAECPLQPACAYGRARRGDGEDGGTAGDGAADPAVGSARVSQRQAPFEGSDRQGRGRLLRAAAGGGLGPDDLAVAAGWPGDPARAERVARSLVQDGLLQMAGGRYVLP